VELGWGAAGWAVGCRPGLPQAHGAVGERGSQHRPQQWGGSSSSIYGGTIVASGGWLYCPYTTKTVAPCVSAIVPTADPLPILSPACPPLGPLSPLPPRPQVAWQRLRQCMDDEVAVEGAVVGTNRGGIIVEVESIRGFCPGSQLGQRVATFEELLDRKMLFKVCGGRVVDGWVRRVQGVWGQGPGGGGGGRQQDAVQGRQQGWQGPGWAGAVRAGCKLICSTWSWPWRVSAAVAVRAAPNT
jgi:hypothetical protein